MTESKPLNTGTLLIRFSSGVVAGLVIAALGWSETFPWHALTLKIGVTVSLVLAGSQLAPYQGYSVCDRLE